MSYLVYSQAASQDMERLNDWLAQFSVDAADKATAEILRELQLLKTNPTNGVPVADRPYVRKLVIEFGKKGYVAFHKYNRETDTAQVVAVLHQNEQYDLATVGLKAEQVEGW
jgi:plasmid stabilization system protein ParE